MWYRLARSGLLCVVHGVVVSSLLWAKDVSQPFTDPQEVPSVLSATRLQQSLFDTPAAVTVIDRQMIEQSGVREIPELLRLVPGMVVGYDIGSDAFVSLHGTSADLARRMQVLVDGRSVYQPLLAAVDWVGLPLELADIERIEVIRGPNSATWGANSFFAVVNIVTRHPADVERTRLSYRRGDDGIEDFLARVAHHSDHFDVRLTAAGRSDDGFTRNLSSGGDFTDSKDVESVYGRAVWSPQPTTTVELSAGTARMDAQQQYRATFYLTPPVAERENDHVSLAWEQELSDSNRLRLQASHSVFRRDELWLVRMPRLVFQPPLGVLYEQNRACAIGVVYQGSTGACTPAEMPLLVALNTALASDPLLTNDADFYAPLRSREQRTEVELHDIWQLTPDLRTVFGVTFDEARVDSQIYLGGEAENTVWRGFAHGEWRFAPQWLLNLGANRERDDGAGDFFSPRVALNWQFRPNQALRIVYSEAVRTPDILEDQADYRFRAVAANPADAAYSGTFFQTGRADGSAPTERIAARELGYYARFEPARLTLDWRAFRNDMELSEHNLEVDGSEGFLIRSNEPLRLTGSELALDWRPWPSQRFQLNYAYLDMDGSTLSNDNTHFVPQHSGSAAWWQDYRQGWQLGTTYAFYNDLRVGQFFFDRLDVRLAKQLRLPRGQGLALAAVLQSRLTDEPELRKENGGDRQRGWVSLDWHY